MQGGRLKNRGVPGSSRCRGGGDLRLGRENVFESILELAGRIGRHADRLKWAAAGLAYELEAAICGSAQDAPAADGGGHGEWQGASARGARAAQAGCPERASGCGHGSRDRLETRSSRQGAADVVEIAPSSATTQTSRLPRPSTGRLPNQHELSGLTPVCRGVCRGGRHGWARREAA